MNIQAITRHTKWLRRESQVVTRPVARQTRSSSSSPVEIAPNDPIVAYFLSNPGATEVERLHLDSPALNALRAANVKMVIPLVSQGELVGLLNLGPRLSEQDYSVDDRGLLNTLATQAAPALRVAQLVREQQAQIRARERIEQELRVARLIQQTLLPKELPVLPGWQVAAYYQPARAVGGDFYDFLPFEDGRLGLVIGDVTDKGVPAALVMATTRSILRTAAVEVATPGQVLERANDLLYPDIPPKMFVTCLYAILDPRSGHLSYANAGHDLPHLRHGNEVCELRATGMPLGLMPGMNYEEKEAEMSLGDSLLLYSDGLVEAHNPTRDMFGFPHLMEVIREYPNGTSLVDYLLDHLAAFTGEGWEQEDDVTLVTLQRSENYDSDSDEERSPRIVGAAELVGAAISGQPTDMWRTLGAFKVASEPGNERQAMQLLVEMIQPLNLRMRQVEQLKTAVAEATMNAMEHGNQYQSDKPVEITILANAETLLIRIVDQGGNRPITQPEAPDLEAKLAEIQTPRGWGLFLIKSLVDDMRITSDATHHTIELLMSLKGDNHAEQAS